MVQDSQRVNVLWCLCILFIFCPIQNLSCLQQELLPGTAASGAAAALLLHLMWNVGRRGGGAALHAEQLFLCSLPISQRVRCGHLHSAGVRTSTAMGAGQHWGWLELEVNVLLSARSGLLEGARFGLAGG